jgi:hypothetical protein
VTGLGRRAVAALWLFLAVPPIKAGAEELGSAATVRDFMIQDVCLDDARAVVDGVSPIDGDPRCVAQRDLMPGEKLSYHKHDHPAAAERAAPRGYQRHDSFPVETAQFGLLIEHSFDFGFGEGRQFGKFDTGRGDGGDIALVSQEAVSIAATEDGGAGFQLFVGADCRDRPDAAALNRSWIIALVSPDQPLRGETVARLRSLKQTQQEGCPARLNAAFTRWHVQPVQYRAADGQGRPVTLTTLISEHYGGEHPESADHVERFYFTRELGSTRWERWQHRERSRGFSADRLAKAASELALSGRCSKADAPAGGAPLVMIDCREWSRTVTPDQPGGDPPGFFLDAVRSRHLAAGLFAAPQN